MSNQVAFAIGATLGILVDLLWNSIIPWLFIRSKRRWLRATGWTVLCLASAYAGFLTYAWVTLHWVTWMPHWYAPVLLMIYLIFSRTRYQNENVLQVQC